MLSCGGQAAARAAEPEALAKEEEEEEEEEEQGQEDDLKLQQAMMHLLQEDSPASSPAASSPAASPLASLRQVVEGRLHGLFVYGSVFVRVHEVYTRVRGCVSVSKLRGGLYVVRFDMGIVAMLVVRLISVCIQIELTGPSDPSQSQRWLVRSVSWRSCKRVMDGI